MKLRCKNKNDERIYYLHDEDTDNDYIKEFRDCNSKIEFYHKVLLSEFEISALSTIKERKKFIEELSFATLKSKIGWQIESKRKL